MATKKTIPEQEVEVEVETNPKKEASKRLAQIKSEITALEAEKLKLNKVL